MSILCKKTYNRRVSKIDRFLIVFGGLIIAATVGSLALLLFLKFPLEGMLTIIALGVIWMAWMGLRDTREEDGRNEGMPPHSW